jgi:hypothetical protein
MCIRPLAAMVIGCGHGPAMAADAAAGKAMSRFGAAPAVRLRVNDRMCRAKPPSMGSTRLYVTSATGRTRFLPRLGDVFTTLVPKSEHRVLPWDDQTSHNT